MSTTAHRYNSYGRTRQPKNLMNGKHAQEAATSTSDPSAATDGMSTENQRYLHLYFENSESGAGKNKSIEVFGYIHAFGQWFVLYDTAGTQVKFTDINGASSYKVHEIAGVDRIYLKTSGAAIVTADKIYAAGSTFQGS